MITPDTPNNNMPKLPWDIDFRDTDLLIALNNTNKELLELKGITHILPNPQILIDFLSFREGVDSNAIEQINTTVYDALLAQQQNINKRSKENKETINYKESILYGFDEISQKGAITINDLIHINKLLIGNDGGIVSSPDKKIEKKIGEIIEVMYTPPQGIDLIKELCYNLESYLNDSKLDTSIDSLFKLPIIHYQFEAIHPFSDGNGRVGRILIILYLVLSKKLSFPLLFLSEYINQNKTEYYQLLHNIDVHGKNAFKQFALYMFEAIQIQSIVTRTLILKIITLYFETKSKIKADKELNRIYSKELIDYLFRDPIYNRATYAFYMKVTKMTAGKHLKLLQEKGICVSDKYKTSVYYVNREYLNLIINK